MIDFDELTEVGIKLLGDPEDPKVERVRRNFYGASVRIRSAISSVDAHVKANPANFANEAKILAHFREVGLGERVPELLASSPDGVVVATRTCGEPMRDLFKGKMGELHGGKTVVCNLADALVALVEVQSRAMRTELIAARAELLPTDELPELIERLGLGGLEDSELSDENRRRLDLMAKQWIPMAEELARLDLDDFWDHGDFGSGNVLLSADEPRRAVLIDLSESAIMCPCFSAA